MNDYIEREQQATKRLGVIYKPTFMTRIVLLICLIGLSCNARNKKSDAANNLLDNGYPCFEYTDQSYARVNSENIDEIVSGYLKKDFANTYSYSLVKAKGQKPSIFILNYDKENNLIFTSLENNGKDWCTTWSNKIPKDLATYFAVTDGKINFVLAENSYDTTNYEALKVEGCYPHMCNTDHGLFYYNLTEKKGYLTIYSTEPKEDYYPFGLPTDYKTLFLFETQVLSKITPSDNFPNIIAFPKERKIPALDFIVNNKEFDIENLLNGILKKSYTNFNKNDYMLGYSFLFDFDEDKKIDILFRVSQKIGTYNPSKIENGYYLYSNNKLYHLSLGYTKEQTEDLAIAENPSDELIYYIDTDKTEYLIITTTSTGNFNGAEIKGLNILKRNGPTFDFFDTTNNTQLINRIVHKFNLEKDEYSY